MDESLNNHAVLNEHTLSNIKGIFKARFPSFLRLYLESLDEALKTMKAAIENGEPKRVEDTAHTIKSSSLTLGAEEVDMHARYLEARAEEIGNNSGETAELKPLYDKFAAACNRVQPLLEQELQACENASP